MTSVPGITGISMAILLCMITYSASSSSRRANYRRFWKIHHLFILFYILLLLHACSGVLKYQTNISEHIPGCFVGFNSDDPNGTVFVAEPEPEPEGNPRLSGDMVVVPELGPIPEGEYFGHSSEESESVPNYVFCRQPEPKFKSCATEAWIWMLIPLTLYIIERGTRLFGQSASTTKIVEHPNDVLEIEFFNKSIAAEPGQSIWIRCPSVSSIESHPFTLTSVPTKHHPYFTIHMAVTGEWTGKVKDLFTNHGVKRANSSRSYSERQDSVELFPKALLNCEDSVYNQTHNRTISTAKVEQSEDVKIAIVNGALETSSSEVMHQPRFYVDGPYGTPMQDIFRYSTSVCVAGGIGITPYAAVLNMIRFNYNLLEKRKLRRIYLIWTCRSVSSFEWFIDLINAVQSLLWNRNRPDFLNVYLHVTSAEFGEMRCLSEKYPSLSRCRLQAGRPQFKDMFRELSERHQRSTIGVFCCGSKSLNNAVREHCLRTKPRTRANFVFNKESF